MSQTEQAGWPIEQKSNKVKNSYLKTKQPMRQFANSKKRHNAWIIYAYKY